MARPAGLIALFGVGCGFFADPDERVARCNSELVALVRWRDGVEGDLSLGKGGWTPETLAAEEKRRVEATAATIAPRRPECGSLWTTLLYQAPLYPALRLREETLLHALGAAPHDYPPESVGFAGVTTDGRLPVEGLQLK